MYAIMGEGARFSAPITAPLRDVGGDTLELRGNGFSFSLPVETIRESWSTGLSRLLE